MAALKGQYAAGPPKGAPSAGVGSVLDSQSNALRGASPAMTPTQSPLVPAQTSLAPQDLSGSQGSYGSRPGEQRLGFAGVRTQ